MIRQVLVLILLAASLLCPAALAGVLSDTPWTFDSDAATAFLGDSVATAGDANGDGYSDIVVGAPLYDGGHDDEGRIYLFYGSPTGPEAASVWTWELNQAGAQFGISVATAGDVTGDGISEIIVGALAYDNGSTVEGRAFLFHGTAGLPSLMDVVDAEQAPPNYGVAVATAGDVNSDGYSDVIVGAPWASNGHNFEGRASVYHGSSGGISEPADWVVEADRDGDRLGYTVSVAGDVNGDGFSDVIVGAPYFETNGSVNDEGRVLVYHGSASGLSTTAFWTARGAQINASYGNSVSTAGDVNGDGYADVIVGANDYNTGQPSDGAAFVYHGSSLGLSATENWLTEGDIDFGRYGRSVSTAGDVNGDGYADVLVGHHFYENGQIEEGAVRVYLGSPSGLSLSPDWQWESDIGTARFGWTVGFAGDVNADGFSDILVGAPHIATPDVNEGRVYLFYGSPEGPATWVHLTAASGQDAAFQGTSVASAGDVNGDYYADIIIGAPEYDNGEANEGMVLVYHGSSGGLSGPAAWTAESNEVGALFGQSVASAGDVNGDGYSDVVIGSPYSDDQNGKIFIYHGSNTGLRSYPAGFVNSGDLDSQFGHSVAGAGDINGDGYADVVVGAPYYQETGVVRGAAFLYLGSFGGLVPIEQWSFVADQIDAELGFSVASAGDVNADGYSDVIIGAPGYDNGHIDEGRIYVFHSTGAGLPVDPSINRELDFALARFGTSVASAGDVNGDGYSDVIAGAPFLTNPQLEQGAAMVFHGSSNGPNSPANWFVQGAQDDTRVGYAVGPAGDVNGDGYSDVIIGATHQDGPFTDGGRIWIYLGSATGLSVTSEWTIAGDASSTYLGNAVSTAGDVDGDGYDDVIVGHMHFDGGVGSNHGRALVFLGNQGRGRDTHPIQVRIDFSAPVQLMGLSSQTNNMVVGHYARSWMGRTRAMMHCEASPVGVPLDPSSAVIMGVYLDLGTTGGQLTMQCGASMADTAYHGRSRLQAFPFLQYEKWQSLGPNGALEADFRTGVESCTPVAGDDSTCNGVDDDCDHQFDEDADSAGACLNALVCDGTEFCHPGLGCENGPLPDCDDGVACTNDFCQEPGGCQNNDNDINCTDGQYCNGAEHCDLLLDCQPGTPPDCDDAVACTVDSCDEVGDQCLNTPDDAPCDNGQYCDGAETCDQFAGCGPGAPPDCTDAVGCTVDSCDEVADLCMLSPDDASCDDTLWCNGTETCDPFMDCLPGTPQDCADAVTCTVDSCNDTTDSCDHLPDDGVCDDGQYCNGSETCDLQNGCLAGALPDCGDAHACTIDGCIEVSDSCSHLPNDSLCNDGNQCTLNSCDPGLGCQTVNNDGADCSVGNCDSTCQDGLCVGCTCTDASECNDGVGCTQDDCAGGMCINLPDNTACDDGSFCTGTEICDPQQDCQAGTEPDCADDVGCTADACDELNNRCEHLPQDASCDDGLFCNGSEVCDVILDCQPGVSQSCSDGIGCTDDECDEDLDACSFPVSAGYCFIAGSCYPEDSPEPGNPCRACLPGSSVDDWSDRPAGSVCGESQCQEGWYTPPAECDGAAQCVDQADRPCETGVCMNDLLCEGSGPTEGYLWVSEGPACELGARVRSDLPVVVLRVDLQSEGVGGTLNGMRLSFPGLEDIPLLWSRPEVRLHLDRDLDDQIDPDSQPLGTAILQDGTAQFDGLGVTIPALSRHQLLVELVTVRAAQAASIGFLAVLALLSLILTRRRVWLAVLLVAALSLGTISCVRYGFYRHLFTSSALIESDADLRVSARPGDQLVVEGAPIEGNEFLLDLSR